MRIRALKRRPVEVIVDIDLGESAANLIASAARPWLSSPPKRS